MLVPKVIKPVVAFNERPKGALYVPPVLPVCVTVAVPPLQSRGEVMDRIEKGQLLVGSPDTVLKQIVRIRDELGAGLLDLVVASQLGDKTAQGIELFGTKVLPRMQEL